MDSGASPGAPSYFEMVAQDRLVPTLRPAFFYVLGSLARWYPRLSPLVSGRDELFAALTYILEAHYLRAHDASFGENFYGLKRVRALYPGLNRPPVSAASLADAAAADAAIAAPGGAYGPPPPPFTPFLPAPSTTSVSASSSSSTVAVSSDPERALTRPLRPRDRGWALFALVAVPYLRSKAEAWYEARADDLMINSNSSRSGSSSSDDGGNDDDVSGGVDASVGVLPRARLLLLLLLRRIARVIRRICSRLRRFVSGPLSFAAFAAFPYVHAAWELLSLWYQLSFLLRGSRYYSPLHHAARQPVVRISADDLEAAATAAAAATSAAAAAASSTGSGTSVAALARNWDSARSSSSSVVGRALRSGGRGAARVLTFLAESAKWGILAGVFAFKVVEWWNSPASRAARQPPLCLPPPPPCPVPLPKAAKSGAGTGAGAGASVWAPESEDLNAESLTASGAGLALAKEAPLRPAPLSAGAAVGPSDVLAAAAVAAAGTRPGAGAAVAAGAVVPLPSDYALCPVCRRRRENPAALPTGFVFCYRCAVEWVRVSNTCPVTGAAVCEDEIRKVYDKDG